MRRLAAILVLVALAGCTRAPRVDKRESTTCTHLQSERAVRGLAICEDVWICARPPGTPYDRIGLRRLTPCDGGPGPIVLYLPGMHMNGELPISDARYDIRLYLAQAGLTVWALDWRTHAVAPDVSQEGLAAVGGWTADQFVGDASWALRFVNGADPGPLFVMGFSYGAQVAYRLASDPDLPVAGLVLLDGGASSGRGLPESGPVIDVGGSRLPWPDRARLLDAVVRNPGSPSPVPGQATAGDTLAETLWSAASFGGRGGLSAARDGITDVGVAARLLRSYDRWWPRGVLDTGNPKPRRTPLPVLAFATGNLGPVWAERVKSSAKAFGGDRAVVRELPHHGHIDVLIAEDAAHQVYEPTRAWLTAQSGL